MAESVVMALLRELVEQGDSKEAVAKRLGRSRQWLYTALEGGPIGAAVCLRLARLEGRDRIAFLRAEGHNDLADELVAAGLDAPTLVSAEDRTLLAKLHALTEDQQHHFRALIESVADATSRVDSRPGVDTSAPRERPRRRRR